LAIARSILLQWGGNCGVQLPPLVDALRDVVIEHSVIHGDETPVKMRMSSKCQRLYTISTAGELRRCS